LQIWPLVLAYINKGTVPAAGFRLGWFVALPVFIANCVQSPTAPASGRSAASLVIEGIRVEAHRFSTTSYVPLLGYEVRFLLRELEGKSGATIQTVSLPGEERYRTCWRAPLRVPPGGTLDVFYTDAGLEWLGDCAPYASGFTGPVDDLELVVTFKDDDGRAGIVRAVATVPK
jgi:hypothetical protein